MLDVEVEQVIEHLDELVEAPGGIEHARNTIFAAAFLGRLLPQRPGDTPVSELLMDMAQQRASLGIVKKEKKPVLQVFDREDIPDSWQWVHLGECASRIEYGYTASALDSGDVQMLRITDLQPDGIDWDRVPFCDISSEDEKKYRVERGDILFARTGGTVGKSHLIFDVQKSVFASYLIRLRVLQAMSVDFVALWLQSPAYWRQIWAGVAGTGQPNFNGTKLAQLDIALPPREEQDRLVDVLSELQVGLNRAQMAYDSIYKA